MNKPSLSLVMIGDDSLDELVMYCNPAIAEEFIFVHTGNDSYTRMIIEDLGAKVFEFEWCDDFSTARNFAASKATGDWILSLDCDEEIHPAYWEGLRTYLETDNEYGELTVHNLEADPKRINPPPIKYGSAPRLWRNGIGIEWQWLVHERLTIDDKKGTQLKKTAITHFGYLKKRPEVSDYYYTLNQRQLELTPRSPRHWFFLGVYHEWHGKYWEALKCYNRAILYATLNNDTLASRFKLQKMGLLHKSNQRKALLQAKMKGEVNAQTTV